MNVHSLPNPSLELQLAVPPAPDQRVTEILSSVRHAFAEKGFDGASMQDLARAAGMSVGNFYRYFPSKSALVEALISVDLADMQRDFGAIIGSARPMEALRTMIRARIPQHQHCQDGALWAEIAAAAMRKPEIGAVASRMEDAVVGYLTAVFAIETGLCEAEARGRFSAQAAYIMLLFKAAASLGHCMTANREHLNALIIRTIEQTLDEIASTARKV